WRARLAALRRVYALSLGVRSFVAVHVAKLPTEMNCTLQMRRQVPSTIIGPVAGVRLPSHGSGAWSVVWRHRTQTSVCTLHDWMFIKWKPSFIFNKRRFQYHFNFGYKMTFAGVLDTVYNDAYNIVIGKMFSPATVGFYSQAENLRLFPVKQLSTVMNKVTYPLFSSLKNDDQLKSAYRLSMRLILFAVVPLMLLLIVIAEDLFLLLLGDKWLPSVPYFQILAIASIFRSIGVYNLNILKVKGKSDMFLKLEIIKKIVGVIAIAVTLPFGILPLVYSLTVTSVLFAFLNALYSGKLINYRVSEQIKDIRKIFISGVIAA